MCFCMHVYTLIYMYAFSKLSQKYFSVLTPWKALSVSQWRLQFLQQKVLAWCREKKKKRLFWENLDNIIMKNKVTYQTLVTSCYLSDSWSWSKFISSNLPLQITHLLHKTFFLASHTVRGLTSCLLHSFWWSTSKCNDFSLKIKILNRHCL